MRPTRLTLAKLSRKPPSHNIPQLNVLPPLPLYRRLLRAHRKLSFEHRTLGDEFVKREFRLHRNEENPLYIIGFLTNWQQYAEQIEGDKWRDAKLDVQKLEKMSDQQIIQFYELMHAAQGQESEYTKHFEDTTGSDSPNSEK
ncbi:hypothetical protein V1512DRAFT_289263 [Lipomyces arxii]|uniref:uncharacterized protein n=1 Tax=Lipomyces arxii TaxID=56418 RepID=UPI0034CF41CA